MPELPADDLQGRCRRAIVRGSSSFHAASLLFEPRLRADVRLLYAWCRRCDDEVDGQDHGHGRAAGAGPGRFAELRGLTRAALSAHRAETDYTKKLLSASEGYTPA